MPARGKTVSQGCRCVAVASTVKSNTPTRSIHHSDMLYVSSLVLSIDDEIMSSDLLHCRKEYVVGVNTPSSQSRLYYGQ